MNATLPQNAYPGGTARLPQFMETYYKHRHAWFKSSVCKTNPLFFLKPYKCGPGKESRNWQDLSGSGGEGGKVCRIEGPAWEKTNDLHCNLEQGMLSLQAEIGAVNLL